MTWQVANIVGAVERTPHVKTIAFDVPGWPGHRAGQHVDVRLTADDGQQAERSYSIASAPSGTRLLLTLVWIDDGEVYAGRFLIRHGCSRDGLAVSAGYDMASDRPARVSGIRLTVRVPAGPPPGRWAALRAVVSHCTVHNSLAVPSAVTIDLQ